MNPNVYRIILLLLQEEWNRMEWNGRNGTRREGWRGAGQSGAAQSRTGQHGTEQNRIEEYYVINPSLKLTSSHHKNGNIRRKI